MAGVCAVVKVTDGVVADALYRKSIDDLSGTRAKLEVARTHLLYGEWLRRERRRLDARDHLNVAHEEFSRMGAGAFAGRGYQGDAHQTSRDCTFKTEFPGSGSYDCVSPERRGHDSGAAPLCPGAGA